MEHDVYIIVTIRGDEQYVGIDRQKAKLTFVQSKDQARSYAPGEAVLACEIIRARFNVQSIRLEPA